MSTTIPGNLHVADDGLADMVGNAALNATASSAWRLRMPSTASRRSCPPRACAAAWSFRAPRPGSASELYVVIEYGTNISAVSRTWSPGHVRARGTARVPLDGVEVHVQGVKVRK